MDSEMYLGEGEACVFGRETNCTLRSGHHGVLSLCIGAAILRNTPDRNRRCMFLLSGRGYRD
jgi:hypothetical protein